MLRKHLVDQCGIDIVPAPYDDIFLAAEDPDKAVLIDHADIARRRPAQAIGSALHEKTGIIGLIDIARDHRRPRCDQHAAFVRSRLAHKAVAVEDRRHHPVKRHDTPAGAKPRSDITIIMKAENAVKFGAAPDFLELDAETTVKGSGNLQRERAPASRIACKSCRAVAGRAGKRRCGRRRRHNGGDPLFAHNAPEARLDGRVSKAIGGQRHDRLAKDNTARSRGDGPADVEIGHRMTEDDIGFAAHRHPAQPSLEQLPLLGVANELRTARRPAGMEIGAFAVGVGIGREVQTCVMGRNGSSEAARIALLGPDQPYIFDLFRAREQGVKSVPAPPRPPRCRRYQHRRAGGIKDRRNMLDVKERVDRHITPGNSAAPHGNEGFRQEWQDYGHDGFPAGCVMPKQVRGTKNPVAIFGKCQDGRPDAIIQNLNDGRLGRKIGGSVLKSRVQCPVRDDIVETSRLKGSNVAARAKRTALCRCPHSLLCRHHPLHSHNQSDLAYRCRYRR